MKTLCFFLMLCSPAFGFTNAGGGLYRTDGSLADTKAAISAARDGEIVEIPNGTYTWTDGVDIEGKAITLRGESLDGVTLKNASTTGNIMINVKEATAGHVVVCNLRMVDAGAVASGNGLAFQLGAHHVDGGKPILVHDIYVSGNGDGHMKYTFMWNTNGGVIWNVTFDSLMTYCTGIQFGWLNGEHTWQTPSTMGNADTAGTANTYVEDCTFLNSWIGSMDFADNVRAVIRHCTFKNAAIYCHGQDSSPFGPRHWEIYNDTFHFDHPSVSSEYLQDWMTLRGGTGVIFGNDFALIDVGYAQKASVLLCVYGIYMSPCYTQYPVPRQVGQSWKGAGGYSYPEKPDNGTGYYTDPIYIWDNTGTGSIPPHLVQLNGLNDDCGNGMKIADFVKEGRDYVLGPKPGYAPYTYPHPLRTALGGGGPGPTPTPNPTPTPGPTPTPTPGPSPTPTPAPSPTPPPVTGPNQVIQAVSEHQLSSTDRLTATLPNVKAGHLIAVVAQDNTGRSISVRDNLNARAYDAAVTKTNGNQWSGIFYLPQTAAGNLSVTASFSKAGGDSEMYALELSGPTALEAKNAAQGNSESPNSGSITTAEPAILLSGIVSDSFVASGAGGGWTTTVIKDTGNGSQYSIQNAGTHASSYSLGASTKWTTTIAAFSGGSGGSPTPSPTPAPSPTPTPGPSPTPPPTPGLLPPGTYEVPRDSVLTVPAH